MIVVGGNSDVSEVETHMVPVGQESLVERKLVEMDELEENVDGQVIEVDKVEHETGDLDQTSY